MAKVWRGFGFEPTLSFLGTESERKELRLEEHGEVVTLDPSFGARRAVRDWRVTWGLFYAASLFPVDICMTHGIDQIPLSRYFDSLFLCPDKYVVGLADAYGSDSIFPSSHHVAVGELFKSELEVENRWEDEITKVEKYGEEHKSEFSLPFFDQRTFWGLDEIRSSSLLLRSPSADLKQGIFHSVLRQNRLDRGTSLHYDPRRLLEGGYSEIHCPRPILPHTRYIETLLSGINYAPNK
ncbi:MAG: hypothetical protein E6R03_09355 [Hyphomicrobiaceae bacterium]|nr:MAG: hypothetical protein E6R03_09355 [Hyphomicrobiaceae bacterium]